MNQYSPEGFVFGPVEVEAAEFRDGDPYLRVTIVYEGDLSKMDTNLVLDQLDRILPVMVEEGIEEFPITYFSEKSAWEARNRGRKKIAGG